MSAPACPTHLLCEDEFRGVTRGDTVKLDSSSRRWRFMRHVLNVRSSAEWVTLYGPLKASKDGGYQPADAAQFVSVDPERVTIPRSQ
jgi:hypothetical protein